MLYIAYTLDHEYDFDECTASSMAELQVTLIDAVSTVHRSRWLCLPTEMSPLEPAARITTIECQSGCSLQHRSSNLGILRVVHYSMYHDIGHTVPDAVLKGP